MICIGKTKCTSEKVYEEIDDILSYMVTLVENKTGALIGYLMTQADFELCKCKLKTKLKAFLIPNWHFSESFHSRLFGL